MIEILETTEDHKRLMRELRTSGVPVEALDQAAKDLRGEVKAYAKRFYEFCDRSHTLRHVRNLCDLYEAFGMAKNYKEDWDKYAARVRFPRELMLEKWLETLCKEAKRTRYNKGGE